jgi:hypothetical protein
MVQRTIWGLERPTVEISRSRAIRQTHPVGFLWTSDHLRRARIARIWRRLSGVIHGYISVSCSVMVCLCVHCVLFRGSSFCSFVCHVIVTVSALTMIFMMETCQLKYNGILQDAYFDGRYFKTTYKFCLYCSFRTFDNQGTTFKQQNAECSALDIYTITPYRVLLHVSIHKWSLSGNQYQS